ncbi:hypothetical protein QEH52_01035 [Coraliomargarita sp. SDUM461003]|uniref:Uncharacterized protein n=1 Tax=Thalassobacterium maritimum TaxID=3041265 RepID=A0ABU1API4_9BACT|nr:hypothetical protein [Coraliomargarita sp. SDUM461003]MDQ8206078.1 hypothetical protein [Coraliomargarita sp. SDUM461003]
MKTNSKSGKSPLLWMGVVAAIAVMALIGIVALRSVGGGTHAPLPVADFAQTPKNFSGNRYEFEGRIDRQLGFEEGVGRIILTQAVDDESPVPLYVAAEHDNFSPNPGQVYRFSLRVDGDGILNVEEYEKL